MIVCESLEQEYQIRCSDGARALIADATEDKGGGGAGFRPHDLLEAALGACISMACRMYAKNHDIPLSAVTTTVSLNRANPSKPVFEYNVALQGELSDEQRQRVLRAVHACPVHKTLASELAFTLV
jgi:putative redox protein